jgi:hypothetical protein
MAGAYIVRFGLEPNFVVSGQEAAYIWLSATLTVVWWLMLGVNRQPRILGRPDEYNGWQHRCGCSVFWPLSLMYYASIRRAVTWE